MKTAWKEGELEREASEIGWKKKNRIVDGWVEGGNKRGLRRKKD